MAVIPDFKSTTLSAFLKQNVAPGSTVYTDGLKSFTGLQEAGFKHVPRSQPLRTDLRKGAKSAIPLADRTIGNLQQWLIGTYPGVSRDQLQFYLDEFVFRHNRRRQPMAAFQTLLGLGTGRAPTPYELIRGAKDNSKQNVLRQAYGSPRTALTQNVPQVALEMGHSIQMVKRHTWKRKRSRRVCVGSELLGRCRKRSVRRARFSAGSRRRNFSSKFPHI